MCNKAKKLKLDYKYKWYQKLKKSENVQKSLGVQTNVFKGFLGILKHKSCQVFLNR